MTDLGAPVDSVKGIGAAKKAALGRMGIRSAGALLWHFPRDYEDRRGRTRIASLSPGMAAAISASVVSIEAGGPSYGGRGARRPLKLTVCDRTGTLEIVFFKADYLAKSFAVGKEYAFYGRVSPGSRGLQMAHPDFSAEGGRWDGAIVPVYPLASGISQKDLRRWTECLLGGDPRIDEPLPEGTLARNRLCGIGYALRNIHFPEDRRRLMEARYRLIFEELLTLQAGLMMLKSDNEAAKGMSFGAEVRGFVDGLPYRLTAAQRRALADIDGDMGSGRAMNRLLQGDVGSGKTVVAAAAMYKAVKSGFQAAMMAPTETLAWQHFGELRGLFAPHGVRTGFLAGGVRGAERRALLEKLKSGEIDLLVGTHAVIQPEVVFGRLGIVVTDEQHRFGVAQRVRLQQKGESPDILVMTATPIPRTLAFIVYGDLDISVMDEKPPGRQAVFTKATDAGGRDAAYEFMRREIRTGSQAYVVAPLVDDGDGGRALKSATGLHAELARRFKGHSVALIHGQMRQSEKDAAMRDFYAGKAAVLVSTVLIEVGINVPNATIMLIENAERFGLAQLHQLRGRVGRGERQSYCILVTERGSAEAEERARIMVSTDDGFAIAEKDLELRGPGEFFGARQHGMPRLRIANLLKHVKVLAAVKDEAHLLLAGDPGLSLPENRALRERIAALFSKAGEGLGEDAEIDAGKIGI
ncbi:MAG: ATP-dependent DNA helicase RecG [Clostridiales Family XIII bacterium]|jgi:ATP-dependent DNA helicase RecG|nr:ATP-dependent DNA helicase RecG [Clostridiales Family XIII bacterium]